MNTQNMKVFTPNGRSYKHPSQCTRPSRLRELLKFPPRGKPLLDAINKGFSAQMLRTVANTLSVDIYKLGTHIDIKISTLNRRLRDGTLTTAESDRLFRFTEVYDAAFDLFESDMVTAYQWLCSPAIGLGDDVPIYLIRTSTGSNDVLLLISKIEYGVLV